MAGELPFVNLHNHTEYSLLDGMISIKQLVNFAKENGQPAIAMTDHGVMGGFWEFYNAATEAGIKPLIGCELYLVESMDEEKRKHEKRYHLTAIAKNNTGLKNLFKLTTKGHLEGHYKGRARVLMEWVTMYKEGIIFLSGCIAGPIGQMIIDKEPKKAYHQAKRFKEYFGDDFYIEIQPTKIRDQLEANPILVDIAQKLDIKLVATADAHYLKEQVNTHPILLGIQSGGRMWSFSDNCFHLMTGKEMLNLALHNHKTLGKEIVEQAILNTLEVANKCEVTIKKNHHVIPNPYPWLETEEEEFNYLVELCEKGWNKRSLKGKKDRPEYQARLKRELDSIRKLKFVRYFLVVHDLYNNCVIPKGIMYGPGRGSSAGSLVCCLLNITDPDPIEHRLIFERFIAPNRVTEPDIDMDFEDSRRQEIKDYLIERYGAEKVANIGTYGTLKGKMVLRDVSRVLKVPISEVEKVTPFIIQRSGGDARLSNTIEDTFSEFDEAKRFSQKYPKVLPHCLNLEGRIRQAGIHAAGVLIAPFDLTNSMPLEVRGKDKAVTAAIDGNEADAMGFLKLDVLGLKTLSVIKGAIDEIGMKREELVNLDYNDPKVLQKFAEGDTTGVFQFSSIGMADTLKEMPIDSFEDLVSINALYRPGGMRSGICRDFIERKKGAKIEKVDPLYDEITKETYGLIVYQEQVMRIFADMARYPAIEVDAMRRKVAKAHGVEEMEASRDTFLQGCIENGVDAKVADEIYTKILHFGSYGFNRCVSGSTILTRASGNQHQPNKVTIEQFYNDWHSSKPVGQKYRDPQRGVKILSYDSDGRIRPRKVKNVFKTGVKEVYELTLRSGHRIKATKDHKFLTSKGKWKRLEELEIGDCLLVKGEYEIYKGEYSLSGSKQVIRKVDQKGHQGFKSGKENPRYIDGSWIKFQKSKKTALERANGTCEVCKTLGDRMEFHHADGDRTNNEPENIQFLCVGCHKKAEYALGRNKRWAKGYPVEESPIILISRVGKEETYDLEMESDLEDGHNYLANDIVTHNSHAVVYTQIAYWTQWLKTYYPLEFYVASLNCEKDEGAVRELLGEMEKSGFKILLPHASKSKVKFTVEKLPNGEKAVRCALAHIKGIGEKSSAEIERCQPFKDADELYAKANRRIVHRGILRILDGVGAWSHENDEKERDRIVAEGLYPLPVADREIEKAKELSDHFNIEFVDINKIDFSKSGSVYCRGIFSGANYARIGDFGPPHPNSRWKMGDRYVMMDLIDGTAHIRVKFDPSKYQQYKDDLKVGQKVIIHGRIMRDVKMIFAQFIVVLDEEEIMAELAKQGGAKDENSQK